MSGPPQSSSYRLNYSRRRFTDDDLGRLRRELPQKQDSYTYEEVDFSQNELSSTGLRVVLEVCQRCPKLRVLKLYRNNLDDSGATGLAELFAKCTGIEEVHLSHNRFTAAGVETMVRAAEEARPDSMSPLWLRLEQNEVADPDAVYEDLLTRLSVCNRPDERYCTVRTCCKKMKVHLPFFNWQRTARPQHVHETPSTPGVVRVPQTAGVVGPSFRVPRADAGVPAGMRLPPPPPKPNNGTTTTATTRTSTPTSGSSVWDITGVGRHRANSGYTNGAECNRAGTGAAAGYPEAKAGAPTPTPKTPFESGGKGSAGGGGGCTPSSEGIASPNSETDGKLPSGATFGGRPSVVLDAHGKRRILPRQLEDEAASSQFVCPICKFVVINAVITSCSHSFCDHCFRQWVGQQVTHVKKGDAPVQLIPCPQPRCQAKLRKKDICAQSDAPKSGAAGLLTRLRNNLTVRCVHHSEHFKHEFGKDAERVAKEAGITCAWVGDLVAYEEHVRKSCFVENHIAGNGAAAAGLAAPPKTETAPLVAAAKPTSGPADVSGAAEDRTSVRVAKYDFLPTGTDRVQLALKADDLVKVIEVTESGWAAGVRLSKETGEEVGEPGWFPVGYVSEPEAMK